MLSNLYLDFKMFILKVHRLNVFSLKTNKQTWLSIIFPVEKVCEIALSNCGDYITLPTSFLSELISISSQIVFSGFKYVGGAFNPQL